MTRPGASNSPEFDYHSKETPPSSGDIEQLRIGEETVAEGQEAEPAEGPLSLQTETAFDQGIKSSAQARADAKGGSRRRIDGELNMAVSRKLLNDTFTKNAMDREADEQTKNAEETQMVTEVIKASRRIVEPDKE